MAFSPGKFVTYLTRHALGQSHGECAKAVRIALESAGFAPFPHPISAKAYGPTLLSLGFSSAGQIHKNFEVADIIVIQSIVGHPHGHIAGFDGTVWVSDFVQRDLWPGQAYRNARPSYNVYRYPAHPNERLPQ